jgi:hypothetical protein
MIDVRMPIVQLSTDAERFRVQFVKVHVMSPIHTLSPIAHAPPAVQPGTDRRTAGEDHRQPAE